MKYLLLNILLFIICSCEPNTKIKATNNFFDINGLIDEQLIMLDSVNPFLFKKARIEGETEISKFIPNQSAWVNEFMLFRSIDIHKPATASKFSVEENIDGAIKTLVYRSNSPKTTKVDSVLVSEDLETGNPLKISAYLRHGNLLYESTETLVMDFTNNNGKAAVTNYRIEGYQKMVSKPQNTFTIEGEIELP